MSNATKIIEIMSGGVECFRTGLTPIGDKTHQRADLLLFLDDRYWTILSAKSAKSFAKELLRAATYCDKINDGKLPLSSIQDYSIKKNDQ